MGVGLEGAWPPGRAPVRALEQQVNAVPFTAKTRLQTVGDRLPEPAAGDGVGEDQDLVHVGDRVSASAGPFAMTISAS